MSGTRFTPTPEQLSAIQTTGRSVLVSAAAGSGKTAVLAERCAYLVCDAPPEVRCGVDQLLVLTFTDAAAAEMRSRIIESIRARVEAAPHDRRLRDQLALADAAQISTIHSFCLWLVRRWFSEVGVDPTAVVMDAEEAALLKREVLRELFVGFYAAAASPEDPLGADELVAPAAGDDVKTPVPQATKEFGPGATNVDASLALRFCRLVNDYGLGEDRDIERMVLRLFEFTTSLPDWEDWLRDPVETLAERPEDLIGQLADELECEMRMQLEHAREVAERIGAGHPAGSDYAEQLESHTANLEAWIGALGSNTESTVTGPAGGASTQAVGSDWPGFGTLPPAIRERVARFETVRAQVAAFKFPRTKAMRIAAEDTAAKAIRTAAKKAFDSVKNAFAHRIGDRFACFSIGELATNAAATAPYVATLADLVRTFRETYTAEKRRINVLDFADLERLAFELLRDRAQPDGKGMVASHAARTLHERFAHVLVDEFQDINPIQQAILRLTSREADPNRPDNLFVVGDVKQSIYRFRLAEPELFTARLSRFSSQRASAVDSDKTATKDAPEGGGRAIFLQKNFRSRPDILDAVNALFRPLMNGLGTIAYDELAELRPGRQPDADEPGPGPVEVHLLEKSPNRPAPEADDEDDDDSDTDSTRRDSGDEEEGRTAFEDPSDPTQWSPIEREAYLIGLLIRDWRSPGPDRPDAPRRFRDVAVLLRTTRVSAERVAAVLNAMEIPAFAQVGGSLFGALEIRDVLAALNVLDNPQQDIPLAAVLRSGIFGLRLSADELAEIRLLDASVQFCRTVAEYARSGPDVGLRDRLSDFFATVDRLRRRVRRRPLSETVGALLEENGYLAYAAGLPNGSQRRANLLKLHDLSRQFSTFRRQGLHRFLQFLESLEADDRELDVAPVISESEDVVRVMSIHQAKGLEFPVVFLAGLGKPFNLTDRRGRLIYERQSKIGLRVVDTEQMIEYPSPAHSLVVNEIDRTVREEELRILYVATTRARDKLVMVGSSDRLPDADEEASDCSLLSRFSIASATTPLDWVLPIVAAASRPATAPQHELFTLRTHTAETMTDWRIQAPQDSNEALRRAVAGLAPLPSDEPQAAPDPPRAVAGTDGRRDGDAGVEQVIARLDYVYPHLPATAAAATAAASRFKGVYDDLADPETVPPIPSPQTAFAVPPSKYAPDGSQDAIHRGVVTHRVLQHLDFASARDSGGVASELQRLTSCGLLSEADWALVDADSIGWLVSTPLAEAIRAAGDDYRREFRFVATEPVTFFDPAAPAPADDGVLVRGIVDGIIVRANSLELVDFKTDALRPAEVELRASEYVPQVTLYARAMARLWQRPVQTCRLVFLGPREIVSVEPDWDAPATAAAAG